MIKLNYIYISLIAIVVSLMASSCDEYFDIEPNAKNQEFTVNGVSFEMVFVEGGSFIMGATFEQGSGADSDEKPAHQVTLSDYMIGETEVTQELWQAVMGSNPSEFNGNDLPVENVSWDDCQEFIEKLNIATKGVRPKGLVFQLPTEAEWEYAARGGNKSKGYKYSGSNDIGSVAWYWDNSSSKTHAVATKSANELGLYDMSGNVWEWCSDSYGDYSSGSQTNPKGPTSGSDRVSRGGSWSYSAWCCRVSYRYGINPGNRRYYRGLRLALAEGVEPEFEYKTYTINGVSFDMVAVEGGTFTMGATSEQGSDAYSDEKPTHKVTLSDYMIGKTEVTQELWKAVMGSNPSSFSGNNLPVESVSWNDCQEFIEKLNIATKDIRPKGLVFQLPTEAEWEYAARGGQNSKGNKYSGSNDIGSVAWYWDNSSSKTHTVATKSPNELGLYDMSGNVFEWCSDWYGSYSSGLQTNPKGPSSGSYRVSRGGSWSFSEGNCRVSDRVSGNPGNRDNFTGLRLALAEGVEPEFEYKTYTINGVSFDMVAVEGGTFTMGATSEQGSDAGSNEKPAHQVTLSDFMIGKTEVTQELWQAVMGSNPSKFNGNDLPVECVSWGDCQEFIEKLNIATKGVRPKGLVFQLPTEAEWEYAARGGNKSKGYKYSGSNDIDSVAWYDGNSSSKTHTVATKSPNELGLYDMSGNVYEWCSDWYGDYSSGSQTNPKGPSWGSTDSGGVDRGGSWDSSAWNCRVSWRFMDWPGYGLYNLGLRLALAEGVEPETPDEPTEPEFEYKTYTINGVSFDMVSVVGGTFTMGATSEQGGDINSDEIPSHQVTLSDYMIGKTEVTQELWQAVMGSNPSEFNGNDLPVENVSWNDCQEFIKKLNSLTGLNFRLPTEAEWEYAARGGNKSKGYKYSGSNDIGSVAWYEETTNGSGTKPVATKAPNELGLYDMSGNVEEWCNDWYGDYSSGSQTNPKGPSWGSTGSGCVDRGGCWNSHAWSCRVSNRDWSYPGYHANGNVGLRLAL